MSSDFRRRCFDLLMQVPAGRVTTYAEIARALDSRAWRAVGSAMASNTRLIEIPCHRVVRSDGRVGDYVRGGAAKAALLEGEGVEVRNGRVQALDRHLHRF